MATGTVKYVQRSGLQGLNEGDKIDFELQKGQQGKISAGNLRKI